MFADSARLKLATGIPRIGFADSREPYRTSLI